MQNMASSLVGNRIELRSMGQQFLESSLLGQASSDWIIHPDWYQEKFLIEYRLNQLKVDPTLESWLLRAIVRKDDNQMIGHINCHGRPGMDHLKPYCEDGLEIGYTIYEPFRRKGYAQEAIELLSKSFPGKATVVLTIEVSNLASIALAEKMNFKLVGIETERETRHVYLK